MYTGTAYNAPGGYPTTAQAMVDRLIIDTPFLIGVVMNDNYPAVRENAYRLGIIDPNENPGREELTRRLILLDNPEGETRLMAALNVPYRHAANSKVLDAAMAQMMDMVQQSGSYPAITKASDDKDEEGAGWLGIASIGVAGIAGIANAVAQITNGQQAIAAQERLTDQQQYQDFVLAQQQGERNAKLIKWGIGIAAVVVVISLFITLRK